MTTAAPLSRTEIIPLESQRAAAAALARAIRERHTFLALTGECDVGKTIVLDAALTAVAEDAVRLILVGNPRAGPLTLSSVLQQIAQYAPPPSGEVEEGDVERIHAMLQAADQKRVVIVVEDAETLQAKALSFLQLLPELSGLTAGGLQIVLVGAPGLWRLMESESLGRMREQLTARIVVEPLSDAEARHFAAWRCRERLERFGPGATDAAMVAALVRYGLGLPARIDALVEKLALLAPSRGGADAALVAEAAAMLAGGSTGPMAAAPAITRPEPAAPDPRPRTTAPAAPALRRRRHPALLAGLVAAVVVAGWLGFGRLGVPWLGVPWLGASWLPWTTKTAMIAHRASAMTHVAPAAVATAAPSSQAPASGAAPSVGVAAAPPAAPPAAVATAAPNPQAPASGAAPSVSVAATPPAAPPAAGPNPAAPAPRAAPSAGVAPTPAAAPPAAVATAGPNPPAPAPRAAPSASVAPTPAAAPPAAVAAAGPTPPAAPAAPDASTNASANANATTGAAPLIGLRKDFNAFLARAGTDTATMTDAQKRALFAQYLAWRTRQAATAPVAADTSAPSP